MFTIKKIIRDICAKKTSVWRRWFTTRKPFWEKVWNKQKKKHSHNES